MKPLLLSVAFAAAAPALAQNAGSSPSDEAHARWEMLDTYCSECHNATDWAGGIAYDTLSPEEVPNDIKLWETTVQRLRGHLMPPPGSRQPSIAEKDAMVRWLETRLDARRETPRAAHVTAQRLNRTEYANAVRTLLGVEIKVQDLLPPEIEMDGFDNIAAVLTVSPAFLDQYIGAARFIAKRAMGEATPKLAKSLYLPPSSAQDSYIDGMPLGSRGGYRFTHNFPADGEYRLSVMDLDVGLYPQAAESRQTLLILIDGKVVFRGDLGGKEDLALVDKEGPAGSAKIMQRFQNIPVNVKAGQHEVTVTFVERARALSDEYVGARGVGSPGGAFFFGSLRLARILKGVEVAGPYGRTHIGSSPSRDRIMVCQPQSAADEPGCARRIATHLAMQAYRRPVNDQDVASLLRFYDTARKEGGNFDAGVQEIVMAVLSSPDFLYRVIQPKGDDKGTQPLSALELASRLAFFLWSDLPDDPLLKVAASGDLLKPDVYAQQVQRMLTDRRASALVTGFAMRWLNVDDLHAVDPDPKLYPAFNEGLRSDFSTEIELFLRHVLLENRSVLELMTSDVTYLNDRLARHYGVPGVRGPQFRPVKVDNPVRHGLLGKSAVLLRTSYGDRTSPVLRGAWVLERIMGTPATPPPPGVETNLNPKEGSRPTTLRERLEVHRQTKSCNQCHGVIDPLGLPFENFDVTGAWRTQDTGLPIDASTQLPNGDKINGITELRHNLMSRPAQFAQAMTEKLVMYAAGRELEPSDMPQVRQIVRDAAKDDYRFFSIIMGIVNSDAFRLQSAAHESHGEGGKPQTTVAAR